MSNKTKKNKHSIPSLPPFVTNPADLRLLQTVGKKTLVILSGKKFTNWDKYLHMATFVRKGKVCTYSPKSIRYKYQAIIKLCRSGLIPYMLFDIYYRPSRLDIKTRKLAGQYYKRLYKKGNLPPMVM